MVRLWRGFEGRHGGLYDALPLALKIALVRVQSKPTSSGFAELTHLLLVKEKGTVADQPEPAPARQAPAKKPV